jgi:NAD(P)-dependent dehydrogenase (short-subunit alcohol dehydrogenase family)
MNINQCVVLITGAAVRVGRAVALHLAEQGAQIAFSYYLEDEPWQETLQEIKALGVDAIAVQAEMLSADSIQNLIDRTGEKFGKIDVLINNASVWLSSPFDEISEKEWDLAFDVNLRGPFLASQKAARVMRAQGSGLIVNITDLSAFQVWPNNAHHAASKAGLVSLTKSMAFELAPEIRVNAIAPGTVMLPENHTDEKRKWAEEKSLLKRVGSPEDVARTIDFLIENDFVTGSVYLVDGGRSLV